MKLLIRWLSCPDRARWLLAVYWVLLTIATHWPRLELFPPSDRVAFFQVDKAIHVLAFGGLMLLLYLARPLGRSAPIGRQVLLALVIAVLYALVDESTQRWSDRDLSVSDVVAGLVGIVGVTLLVLSPRGRARAGRAVWMVRVLAAGLFAGFFVLALSSQGPAWVRAVSGWLYQPWAGFDKAGHFYLAALLFLVLAGASPAGVGRPRLGLALSIGVVGLAGPIIEAAQRHIGRSADLADLYAHEVGLLAAMTALAALGLFRCLAKPNAREPVQLD